MERGRQDASVVSRITDLPPNFLSTKYAWTAETGGGTRERTPVENAEIRLLALISLWKTIISFFFRDLFV